METTDLFDFNLIWNILSTVTFSLATLGICIFYVVRKQSVDAIFLAIGSFIHFITNIFYSVVLPIMARKSGFGIYNNKIIMLSVSTIGIIGSILFIIGLIMLIFNKLSLQKKIED
jgi:hypothetical protein